MAKKWTVHMMTPYVIWNGIEAESDSEAIQKAGTPPEFDANEPHMFIASEEEDDE